MKLNDFKTNNERLEEHGWENRGVSIFGMQFKKTFGKTNVTIFLKDGDTDIYIGDVFNAETTANDIVCIGNEFKKLNDETGKPKVEDTIYESAVKVENYLRNVRSYKQFEMYSWYFFPMLEEIKKHCKEQNM